MWRHATTERGVALITAVLAVSLLTCLGLALILVTITETTIAGSYLLATQAFYAAEVAAEAAVQELGSMPDWAEVREGRVRSAFVDPGVANVIAADDESRAWRLFACGRLDALVPPGAMRVPFVLAVWVAPVPEAADTVAILGHAYGPRGTRRAIEVVIGRPGPGEDRPRIVAWREVR